MTVGVSTSCFYPLETELSLEELGKGGVSAAEIFFNAACELKSSFIDILTDIKDEYNINVVSIHPTMSLAESFMLFSAYERRFYDGLDSFRRYSEIAAELGARFIILHGGKPNGILEDEEYCDRFMMLQNAVRSNGVTLLQENVARHRAGDLEFMRSMNRILGDDAAFCVDLKQSLRCGYTPNEIIDILGKSIKHFHVSDHSTASDCLLPYNGGFDFPALFNRMSDLGYNGAYIIEVYNNSYHEYAGIIDSYKKLCTVKIY